MKRLDSFQDLVQLQVQDLYNAEKRFAEAQPALAEAATDPELRDALEQHGEVTREQIERLERIAERLGVRPSGKTSSAAEGLVEEGAEVARSGGDPMVRDAALIAAQQRIEHYEISGYGTLRALAQRLDDQEAVRLIDQTLAQERGADVLLTEIAERSINEQAAT